jgi:hypothetical protein
MQFEISKNERERGERWIRQAGHPPSVSISRRAWFRDNRGRHSDIQTLFVVL